MIETPSGKERLAQHFEKSATAVRAYADQFEESYARPALNTTSAFFDEYPISSTFITIFCALAFFPVATFIALSLFAIVSISLVALCCAFLASSAVVLFFLSILVLSLVLTFFVSASVTVFVISSYLVYRLLTLVRSGGREGVSSWAVETKGRFVRSHQRQEASEGSAVVVDVKEPPYEDVDSYPRPKQESSS